MTRYGRGRWRELAVLLVASVCAIGWSAGQVRSVVHRVEVETMMHKVKTVCVGRQLVDVPAQASVALSGAMLDGFDIASFEEDERSYRARIAERKAQIDAPEPGGDAARRGGLERVIALHIPGMIAETLVYGRTHLAGTADGTVAPSEFFSVEAHAHRDGVSFTLRMKIADQADVKLAEQLLSRLQVLAPDEIPTVPGFCIARGVFAEPLPAYNSESIIMYAGIPEHPDLALALFSVAVERAGPGLLARTDRIDAEANPVISLLVTRLRGAARKINGTDGEELVERIRELNFVTTYSFTWETKGLEDQPLQPHLSLELMAGVAERQGGKPVGASLHEDALLALWDGIAGSVRVRPTGAPATAATSAATPPGPGATVKAGAACPQSGWWRCEGSAPGFRVHGGEVQYLRHGETVPQALLLPRQTVWQKLQGIQPSVESTDATAWRLLDRRTAPRLPGPAGLAATGTPSTGTPVAGSFGAADPCPAPLGSQARTGEACPASGWWRCEEPRALDGVRWFARGCPLPAASFRLPAGMFAKAGGPELMQRRATWQLLRHAASAAMPENGKTG